jgi:hypothetical protein
MAAKRKSKAKKKSQPIRTKDPAQSARFLATAKSLEVDESGEAFERALSVVVPKKDARKK